MLTLHEMDVLASIFGYDLEVDGDNRTVTAWLGACPIWTKALA